MHIVIVHVHVKPEKLDEFISITLENAQNSIQEPGITRFDFIQEADEPTRFVLIEAYHSPEDQLKHRETAHYARWRDLAADMMAEPRQGVKYRNLYPEDSGW